MAEFWAEFFADFVNVLKYITITTTIRIYGKLTIEKGKIRGQMGGILGGNFAVFVNFYADFVNVLKYITITR